MTNDTFYSKPTQVYWTCKALLDGRTISHRTEIREMRSWRLGAIIFRLKTDYAWPILTAYSTPDHVAFYSLNADTDRATLRFPPSALSLSQVEGVE